MKSQQEQGTGYHQPPESMTADACKTHCEQCSLCNKGSAPALRVVRGDKISEAEYHQEVERLEGERRKMRAELKQQLIMYEAKFSASRNLLASLLEKGEATGAKRHKGNDNNVGGGRSRSSRRSRRSSRRSRRGLSRRRSSRRRSLKK